MSDDEWTPAFPGQRPPFKPGHAHAAEPGNERALRHGAHSPRRVDPIAAGLVEQVLVDETLGYLQAAAYLPELWAWARAEAQVQLLDDWLSTRGEQTRDGVGDLDQDSVRAAYLLLHRAEARAATGRTRLGLNPLARARLGRDVALGAAAHADVALRMAKRHELEEDLKRQGWTPPPELDAGDGAHPHDAEGGESR